MSSHRVFSPSRIRRNRIDSSDSRNQFFIKSPDESRFHSSTGLSSDFNEKENKIEKTNSLSCKRIKGNGNIIFHNVTRKKLPFIGRQIDKFHSLPLPFRLVGIFIFFLYKVIVTYTMIKLFFPSSSHSELDLLRRALHWNQDADSSTTNLEKNKEDLSIHHPIETLPSTIFENSLDVETEKKYLEDDALTQKKSKMFNTLSNLRILKIVLSTRTFVNNENDLEAKYVSDELIPSLLETFTRITSFQDSAEVDIHLILSWKLKDELRQKIQTSIPSKYSLVIIDDISSHHKHINESRGIDSITLKVVNEYQQIIKQNLDKYDFFTVFDADMRITGNHILHYIQKVNDLYHFIESTHDARENQNRNHILALKSLGISSLSKLAPGYLLVNVVPKDHSAIPLNKKSIPHESNPVDPSICCARETHKLQSIPDSSNIILCQMPSSQRSIRKIKIDKIDSSMQVVVESTNQNEIQTRQISHMQQNLRKKNEEKPVKELHHNQIGWMGTRKQISQWISDFDCFEDILDATNENLNFFDDQKIIRGIPFGCDLVPFLSLDNDSFSKQLVYFNRELSPSEDEEDSQHSVMSVNKFYHEVEDLPQEEKIKFKL